MTFGGKDNRGPSISELQRYIREKVPMRFMLNTGEDVVGILRWFDEHAFSVQPDGEQPFTILRAAVVGYQRHNGKGGTLTQRVAASGPRVASSAAGAASTAAAGSASTDAASGEPPAREGSGAIVPLETGKLSKTEKKPETDSGAATQPPANE